MPNQGGYSSSNLSCSPCASLAHALLTAGIFSDAGIFWAACFATLKDKMMQSCFAVDSGSDLKLPQHSSCVAPVLQEEHKPHRLDLPSTKGVAVKRVFSFSEPRLSPSATAGAAPKELYFRKGRKLLYSSSQKKGVTISDRQPCRYKGQRGDEGSRKVRSRVEQGEKGEV